MKYSILGIKKLWAVGYTSEVGDWSRAAHALCSTAEQALMLFHEMELAEGTKYKVLSVSLVDEHPIIVDADSFDRSSIGVRGCCKSCVSWKLEQAFSDGGYGPCAKLGIGGDTLPRIPLRTREDFVCSNWQLAPD